MHGERGKKAIPGHLSPNDFYDFIPDDPDRLVSAAHISTFTDNYQTSAALLVN